MATATASVNMATAVPITSCAVSNYSRDSAVHISSSSSFSGKRLTNANGTAQRSVSRSSRTLIVRAEQEPGIWETITGLFGSGKKEVSDAASRGEKELNKASGEAKSASGDLGNKAESLKEDLQAQAEGAAAEVKAGVEDLKGKVEEAVESAKTK